MFNKLFELHLPSSSTPQGHFHQNVDLPLGVTLAFGVDQSQPDLLIHQYRDDVLNIVNRVYETDRRPDRMTW